MTSTVSNEIAAAARLVVEEGLEYGPAKRRAARDIGRRSTRQAELPANIEVEDEVRAYLALFCADTQPAELAALRAVAALWLQRMAEFRPLLSGAVWRGSATRLNNIHLQLYCDDSKAAELALIEQGVDFDIRRQFGLARAAFADVTRGAALGRAVFQALFHHQTGGGGGDFIADTGGHG